MSFFSRLLRRRNFQSPRTRQPLRHKHRTQLNLETLEDRCTPTAGISSITQNFNSSSIAPGSTIWFSSVFHQPSNLGSGPAFVEVTNQTITFTAGGTSYNVAVPDASITFSTANLTGSTCYDATANEWDTNLPLKFSGNAFLDGVALNLPNGLPGGIQSVTWQGFFTGSANNIGFSWQWGAAEYTNFSTDLNALNVKMFDGGANSDHPGSPEAYKLYVTAGATGNGGANYTGNQSNTNVTASMIGSALLYPFASSNPLTSIAFNESSAMAAAKLDTTNGFFELWYSDEHALSLGVRQVNVITASGTTTTNYAIAPLTSDPGSATNPALGTTATTGPQAGTDTSGRPISPMLYITDTTNNPQSLSGDWQYGGTGYAPSTVFGTWKGAVRTVNQTTNTVSVVCDADPAANGWNLGPGSDAPPAGTGNGGYGAEVRWSLADLQAAGILLPGHTYRFYVMDHDGDQNKAGGDSGQAAFNYSYPGVGVSGVSTVTISGHFLGATGGPDRSGVLITLTGTTTTTNLSVLLTTYTAADGSYSFIGLQPGTYSLAETLPPAVANYNVSAAAGTVNGSLDGNDDGGTITSILLNAGDNGINYDFSDLLPTS